MGAADRQQGWGTERESPSWDPGGGPGERAWICFRTRAISFPAREGVQLRGCRDSGGCRRVRSSSRPDVGCGGSGFPAWLAVVGARGLRVLLALGESSRQGAPFLGRISFPDQARSPTDQVSEHRNQRRTSARARGLSGGAPHLPRANQAEGSTMRLVCLREDQTHQFHRGDFFTGCWLG